MPKEIIFKKYQIRASSYHWQQISRSIFNFNAYVAARYQQVVSRIPKDKSLKILDIGCGDGVLAWLIYRRNKAKIIGIDTDKDSLKAARKELKARGAKVKFVQASAYQLPFKTNSFDVVVATEIIEHLAKPETMLQEISRVLKPQGQSIITTLVKLRRTPEDKMHVKEFTRKDLYNLLSKYFSQVEIITSHPVWLRSLYTLTLFKLGKYHLDLFRWLINSLVLLIGYNPFIHLSGRASQQLAICSKPK